VENGTARSRPVVPQELRDTLCFRRTLYTKTVSYSIANDITLLFTSAKELMFSSLLWPPYRIGQTIIFLACDYYLSSIFFIPRLILAVGDGCLPYFHT